MALVLFVKYFFVAAILYTIFFLIRFNQHFHLKGKGSTRILVANCVVLAYAVILMLARMVEGGGFGYLVAQLSPFILWPSWALILWGLVLLWLDRRNGVSGPADR